MLSPEDVEPLVARRGDDAIGVADLEVQRAAGLVGRAEVHLVTTAERELADLDDLADTPELRPGPREDGRGDDNGAILLDTAGVVAPDLVAVRHEAQELQIARGFGHPEGSGTSGH